MAFITSSALWACLIPVVTLVLVAGAADRESALIAGHEELALRSDPNVVTTNLANVDVDIAQWLRLHAPNENRTS